MTGPARERRQADHLERLNAVLDGVVRGMSQREIAAETGIPKSTVARMARAALDRYVPDQYGTRTQMLARELKLLDLLTAANLDDALTGGRDAARIVIKAHERRCKLLGLDSPTRTRVEISSSIDREIEELVELLGAEN